MKRTPVAIDQSTYRSSRWLRPLAGAILALSLGLNGWAQNAVSTLAGSGSAGSTNGTGTAASFQFTNPSGVAADTTGNLFVADAANHLIRKVTPLGVVTTFAGTAGSAGSADGAGTTVARFNFPQGIAVDGAGNVFVADSGNNTVRMVTSAGVVSTLAGTAGSAGTLNGTGAAARFSQPLGIAADRAGTGGAAVNVFVADTQNHTIRQIVVATGVVTTLAGTAGTPGSVNGTGVAATFNHPDSLVLNSTSTPTTLYVADTFGHLIRQIVVGTGVVTTLAGSGTAGQTDATGAAASFDNPAGIAIDGAGNVLVADTFNHTIRSITSGGVVTTYAGLADNSGTANGLTTAARFNFPSGIAYDASTTSALVIDTNNQVIRKIFPATAPNITGQPLSVSQAVGTTATFTVTAGGNPPVSYQWQINPGGTGTFTNITPSATYTGVTTATLSVVGLTAAMNGDKFQVIVSNGVGSNATSSAATLTVTQVPVITSAATANFTPTQAFSFTVTATGTPTPTLSRTGPFPSWASFNTSTGVISGTPLDAVGAPFVFTLTATNTAGSVNQTFTLTALTGPVITTHPSPQVATPGLNVSYSVAATTNSGTLTYKWQRQQFGTVGFFDLFDNGHYAGTGTSTLSISTVGLSESGDQFRVVVSSGVGTPATSNSALLTVTQPPTITSLGSATFVEGQFSQFQVQATGSPTPTFSITSGTLPNGISLTPSTGLLSGTPAVGTSATGTISVGVYGFQVTASNGVFPDSQQNFVLTISPTALIPAFTTQPVSVSAALGQVVTFTVVVTGTPTPTIKWQRQASGTFGFADLANDATFTGVNTATLTITNPTSGMSGDVYQAVAFSSSGSTVSSPATLTLVIGTSLSTYAGQAGSFGNTDGTGAAARFNTPGSIAVDPSGNVYVADTSNHVIRKITSGGVVTTLAGTPGSAGAIDGTGAAARFNAPSGIAVNSIGTVYVADTYNHTIRVINPAGTVTTLAGTAGNSGTTDGLGAAARFTYPSGVAVDFAGTVYVADTLNHAIRRIDTSSNVTVFAGLAGTPGAANGLGTNSRFNRPNAIAVDSSGSVYVADSFNHAIRRISTSSEVSTHSGTLGTSGTTDTPPLFNQPSGLAVDSGNNVYVADTLSNTVRKIAVGGVVTTIAGFPGSSGSLDGIGSAARLSQPYGIAVDSIGNIYVADTRNHTIRRSGTVNAPQIQTHPVSLVTPLGGPATFTVVATGAPTPSVFQWQRQAANTAGFLVLASDGVYSGTNTATLMISAVTNEMNGDQFRVLVSNLISPDALSNPATLTVGTAPVFTSPATATVQATTNLSFTVSATGTPTPTFSAIGVPAWATFNAATGVLSGTPPDTAGSPFTITITANNGLSVNQTITLTVTPAVVPPVITVHPVNVAVDQGQTANFSVTSTGTAPLSYQWRKNGVVLPGATSPTLTLSGVQPSSAGSYTVSVQNSVGGVVSNPAALVVNTVPAFATQPRTQTALAGSTVVFSVEAIGGTSFNYQWRKNGFAIAGANGATLTLSAVTSADAGNYDVQVSNSLGLVGSSLATLTVVTSPVAPVITAQPASRTVLLGSRTVLSVSASGAPSPGYQWRRNGADIPNANNATLVLASVAAGDAASYDVVVTNGTGSVTSAPASLRVIARSYAGIYFGTFSNSLGNYAIFVREDNSGVFLGYLPASSAPVMNLNVSVNDAGQFTFSQNAIAAASAAAADAGEPVRAAALSAVTVSGTLGTDGTINGTIQGGANGNLTGARASDSGASQNVAGYYQAGASNSAATSYTIAGPNTQAFAVTQVGVNFDGGLGNVNSNGQVTIAGNRSTISATIVPSARTITGTSTGGIVATYSGASDEVLARQRLVNISSRARVGTGESIAIAGFVISGEESKPVLIRAVGPTIGVAPFNVAGALASPRLELFRGGTSLAVNTGIAGNRTGIDAAGQQAGAFALGASGADAALLMTLPPGNYTAQVSSTTSTAGVALVEVYDLSAAAPGQKLLNIATRAAAGVADATLIAGFVVPPGSSKKVLIRGVGPGLTPFGVSGVLALPTLQLFSASTTVAQNTNWSTSADAAAITAASAQVGAFGLSSNDSAMIVTLAPGNYTAQVLGAGGATGVALIEVYELP